MTLNTLEVIDQGVCQKFLLAEGLVVCEHEETLGWIRPEALRHDVHLVEAEQVVQAEVLVHRTVVLNALRSLAQV